MPNIPQIGHDANPLVQSEKVLWERLPQFELLSTKYCISSTSCGCNVFTNAIQHPLS
jgi:hypothetical protein